MRGFKVKKEQKKVNQTKKKSSEQLKYGIMGILALVIIVGVGMLSRKGEVKDNEASTNVSVQNTQETILSEEGDLIIPIKDISEKANFYPLEVDGTKLEVLAVKAPDGTIRTAFNTCQICYSSGRGYYVQEGDVLVCQNCRNRFNTSDVEVARGGCNPVPIFEEDKVVDENNIIISGDFLSEASVIFTNWKSEY